MAFIPIASRVTWLNSKNLPLPSGAVVHIWTDDKGAGKAQTFTVRHDGLIGGVLDVPDPDVGHSGERPWLIRAFLKDAQIACAVQPVVRQRQVIGEPLRLGYLVRGRVAIGGRAPPGGGRIEAVAQGDAENTMGLASVSLPVAEDGGFVLTCPTGPTGERPGAVRLNFRTGPDPGLIRLTKLIERPGVENEAELTGDGEVSPTEKFMIRGGLAYTRREGLGEEIELRIVLHTLGGERVIESRSVPAAERYEIELGARPPRGDLTVEAHIADAAGRRTSFLGSSLRAIDPASPLELDLLIADPATTLPVFESLMSRVAPHLGDLALTTLPAEKWPELAAAAHLSEREHTRLQRAVDLSRALAERAGADAARVLPALFVLASGAPGETLPSLLAAADETQEMALAAARDAGEIGAEPWRFNHGGKAVQASFDDFLKVKGGAGGRRVLFDPSAEDAPVAARLSALAVTSAVKRRHVMALLESHENPEQVEAALKASTVLTAAEKSRAIALHAAAELAAFQFPLVAALSAPDAKHVLADGASIAAYRPEELAELIRDADAVPRRYADADDPARAFADSILADSFARYQTFAFLARMEATPSLPPTAALAVETLRDHPDFNLYSVPVTEHFAPAGPGEPGAPERVAIEQTRYEALQTIQRLCRLTSPAYAPEVVTGLTAMGVSSAHELIAMGEVRYNDAVISHQWNPGLAAEVYAGAQAIGHITNLLFHASVQPDFQLAAGVMLGDRSDTFPKLADLFGSFDACACVECRSVYSPSAYLAELLHWLESKFVHDDHVSGYAKLMERCGHIAHLELTCENSHTALPFIDLVLEILEYVANRQSVDLSAAAHQTDWRTPELLRDGEHFGATEIPAYGPGRLLDAVYPWSLPYNLWLDQMRTYLAAMAIDRADLVALAGGLRPWEADPGLAAEILGIDDLQFDIIAGGNVPTAGPLAYWNGVDIRAKPVGEILKVSGLSYDTLLDLLKTEYVRHAGGAAVIFSIVFDSAHPCDLTKAFVSPPIMPPYADRIHRLARLRDSLGWSYWEVDEAVIALANAGAGADPLDAGCLVRLAGLKRLQRNTGRPVPELTAWFGRLPAYRGEATSDFYEAELLSKAGPRAAASLLALAPAPDVPDRELANPRPLASLTDAERDQLRESLGMSTAEFEAAAGSMGGFTLDLDTLTWLYRLKSVARAANMPVDDVAALASLAPLPQAWTPQAALRFLDFAGWLAQSGLSWTALHYYLTGDGGGLALASEDLVRVKDRLYGAGGHFHALLSDPPVPTSDPLESQTDRLDRLFEGVVATLAPGGASTLLRAIVAGEKAKFPGPDGSFDPGQYLDDLVPPQPAAPPWGFEIADAVRNDSYPRQPAAPPDPLVKTEAEVKAALVVHMAPQILRQSLAAAAHQAYSELFQLPPDRIAFLFGAVRSTLIPASGTLADLLIPEADLGYLPSVPIAPPADYEMLVAELHLVVARLRRLGLLDAPLTGLEAYRAEPSPGVAAGASESIWFDPFRCGPLTTTVHEAAVQWRNAEEGFALRAPLAASLEELVTGLSLGSGAAAPLARAQALMLRPASRHAGRDVDEVAALLARLGSQGEAGSVAGLIAAAARFFDTISGWGLSLGQAIRFAASPVGAELPAEARLALRGRFGGEEDWDESIREANNGLRSRRRDALVAYLAARHGFDGADGLYAHFLIDVEMSPCMKTSRLALAIASVQLFVQRIFLGLEPGIRFDGAQVREWTWMKNFAVWGAARELFLYPESYLEASLRLDKTPFFETLEEELQQGDLSDERIEDAYVRYVEKVADVARLDIRAFCHDTSRFDAGATLHVIGRTRAEPHRYFHRERTPAGLWTAWTPIEQELDGDHLMMVFWNRRANLLWPTFIERRLGEEDYYEILFNHMSLRAGKWTAKRKLPGKILSGRFCGPGLLNDLDRKTGKLKPLTYDNLTLNEKGTMPVVTSYQYAGPNPIVRPGSSDYFLLHSTLIVSAQAGIPSAHPNSPSWAKIVLHDPNHWMPLHSEMPDPGAVKDFSMASMKRKSYFFRAVRDYPTGGDLHIQVRREFAEEWETYHTGYLEAAYEDGLRLSSDGQVTLEPIYAPPRPTGYWHKFLAARPAYTVPDAMKLRNGFDRIEELQSAPHLAGKLYSKRVPSHAGFNAGTVTLLNTAPTDYELIFEQSNEHHLFGDPFFFEDAAHSYFVARDSAAAQGYRFTSFSIPGTPLFLAELNARGAAGLLGPRDADGPFNAGLKRQRRVFDNGFPGRYAPTSLAKPLWPTERIEFAYGAPAAPYSWEIFFHIPMRIVEALRTAGRYDRALEWVSYIFDPTDQEDTTDLRRYWQLGPFYDYQPKGPVQTLMRLLSTATTPQELAEKQALLTQIAIWRDDPFDPHSVCAVRTSGYMLWAFITYVEILIDWGDKLFRQSSRESIAEATQLYIFARNLLGDRPREVEKADAPPKTYDQIRLALDAFSNAAVEVENNIVAYDIVPGGTHSAPIALQAAQSLYFCIPRNPKLMALWDTVEDRLGKIRRCLNIDGVAVELPLFAARIDPGLLVRARAAGLDIADVLADLAAPRAPYRFAYLIEKAQQYAGEVRSFGAAVLSAIEKRDAEQLQQLRSQHEISIQKAMRNVRVQQRDQARAQVASLQQNRKAVEVRMAAYAARQPMIGPEKKQLKLLQVSQGFATVQAVLQGVASIMHALDAEIGVPCNSKIIRAGNIVGAIAGAMGAAASGTSLSSTMAGLTAAADRRKEEWDLQVTLAGEELKQIEKQQIAAEIGVAIAELELENLDRQTEQSGEVLEFMKFKFSNDKLYSWMASRLAALHRQAYDLALDLAKKAQAAFADELGRPEADFVRFGQWDGQKYGLLAGDSLALQLRQMEAAYIEGNERTYEARRPVSLALLDPAALAKLIADGACEFEIPEWLFDRDLPGLYDRRIKTLSLHLPCVTGPHVPVHARLTLLRHQIRRKPNLTDPPDVRFDAVQSIVTSSGVGDSGLFETNLQDARYLPFEGCGAVAKFRLEVPDFRQFDLTTLSDVILTIAYTAREGGDLFRDAVVTALDQLPVKPRLMMSFKHDFADEWQKFLADGMAAAVDVDATTSGFQIAAPAVPREAEPYATRAVPGTFDIVQAWALTVDEHGIHDLIRIDEAKVPVEGETGFVDTEPFFASDGFKWVTPTDSREDVNDILLVYEKS